MELGAYIQDKMEFEGMIANVGLRWDLWHSKTSTTSTSSTLRAARTRPETLHCSLMRAAPPGEEQADRPPAAPRRCVFPGVDVDGVPSELRLIHAAPFVPVC